MQGTLRRTTSSAAATAERHYCEKPGSRPLSAAGGCRGRRLTTPPTSPSPRIDGPRFHETERVVPGVIDVKRSLAPRPHHHRAGRGTMHVLARQAAQRFGALVYRVEVVDQQIEFLGRGVRLALGGNVHHLERDRTTGEIDA